MRNLCVSGLILLLAGQPAFAAAGDDDGTGPIARSVMAEASRLAGEPAPMSLPGWQAVRTLTPGSEIVLSADGVTGRRVFLVATQSMLAVLNLSQSTLTDAQRTRLIDLAKNNAAAIVSATEGTPYADRSIRLSDAGVFVSDLNVGGLTQIVERWSAADVVRLDQSVRRGSTGMAVLGAVGGLFLGSMVAGGFANTPCYPDCGGVEIGMLLALIGTPIATGYGLWRGSSKMVEENVYRR
jgi:hypothetical protein